LLKLCHKLEIVSVPLQKVSSFVGGIFVGPDIRKVIFDEDFLLKMTDVEKRLE
jgi:hypothetical protein